MRWIQYFWKWISTATPMPLRITELAVLLLAIASLAVRQLYPNWEPQMVAIAWQLPLALLGATLVISLTVSSYHLYQQQNEEKNRVISDLKKELSDLEQNLRVAQKLAYPSLTTLMMVPFFKNKDIPLGEFGLANIMLGDKTFEKCHIHGPAVLLVGDGTSIRGCSLCGTSEANFIIVTNERVDGVLGVINCTFIDCVFEKISFIGNANSIKVLKSGFGLES